MMYRSAFPIGGLMRLLRIITDWARCFGLIPVAVFHRAHHAAWHSKSKDIRRNIARHDTSRPDHGIITDGDTRQDGHARCDPSVSADPDRKVVLQT